MADSLTASSRSFYERVRSKLALSLLYGALGMVALGFTAIAGGTSNSNSYYYDNASGDDADALYSLVSGYGFAAFAFIVAFILLISSAIYISPLFTGSENEKRMIKAPQEIESGYTNSSATPQV